MTKEQVIARSKVLGLDMSDWEDVRIQQIVDIVNAPIEFPKTPVPFRWSWPAEMPWSIVGNWR